MGISDRASDVSSTAAGSRLKTARALLSDQLIGVSLVEVAPDPPLEELGALAGFGAIVRAHDLRFSVYLLDAWGRGHDHAAALRSRAQASRRLAAVAVNGDLLFVGTIAADGGSGDRFLLNDLCSAFAGRE
jgi:hypothetical protein